MTQERHRLAQQLILKARDLESPRGPQASNRVQNRGDRLIKVYWKGQQWAATRFGVQARDGSYSIDRKRVWEDEERGGWIMHMAEKDWVDLEDFAEALRVVRFYERVRRDSRSEAAREGWRNRRTYPQ
jgi:hypothetical protein